MVLECISSIPLGPEAVYTPKDLSAVLRVPIKTLARWRKNNTGPAYAKLPNGEIRYLGGDVTVWLARCKHNVFDEGSKLRN